MAQMVKCMSTMRETWVWSLCWEDSLAKEMATHSSTLALKIPWTEEFGAGYCPWGRKESGTTEWLQKKKKKKKITNRWLLHSTGNLTQYSVVTKCWGVGIQKREDISWCTLLYSRNWHNIVKQPYSNKCSLKRSEWEAEIKRQKRLSYKSSHLTEGENNFYRGDKLCKIRCRNCFQNVN